MQVFRTLFKVFAAAPHQRQSVYHNFSNLAITESDKIHRFKAEPSTIFHLFIDFSAAQGYNKID